MDSPSPFSPVSFVPARESDELLYEPAPDLRESFEALAAASRDCTVQPTFANVTEACRRCRTAFAGFVTEAVVASEVARTRLLGEIEPLLAGCRAAVGAALPQIVDAEESRLARGYLQHIDDRIRLAAALRTDGLAGYLALVEDSLATPPCAATAAC